MEDENRRVRSELVWLKRYAAILTVAVVALGVVTFLPDDGPDVIRARGVVIEDSLGNARILLGAPVPDVSDRIRTDSARAREAWAHRYPNPNGYMRNYGKLQHSMDGLLILGQDGLDQVAIGAPVPDPNSGPRVAPSYGMVINGRSGFERTGYGVLRFPDSYRVSLGMDTDRGDEGLAVALDGLTGERSFNVYDGETRLFMGIAPAGDSIRGEGRPFEGVLLKRRDSVVSQLPRAAGDGDSGR